MSQTLRLSLFLFLSALGLGTGKTYSATFPDTANIHKVYIDGDFEQAIDLCQKALKSGKTLSHQDSVFLFKHLGVMYAAKYETREKGKAYMFKLLQAEPTARIMDMYASDMIYMIFKNIQDEYEIARAKMERAKVNIQPRAAPDTAAKSASNAKRPPDKAGKTSTKDSSSHAWVAWTAGAVAVAGGAALFFVLAQDEPKTKTDENTVP